jgi:FAD/FMN-containing dehydrogenase
LLPSFSSRTKGEIAMQEPTLRNRTGKPVDEIATKDFVAGIGGRAIFPKDPEYPAARRIWNASIDKYPGLILRCSGVADIVQAVRFARANDILVSIRGGGHNVAGRSLCDDGLVIDLSDMRGVVVDPRQRTVLVQAGATLGDVDRETHVFGLAVPTGVISRTGIAGLTLGGGVGWLVRKYGLTCDNVLAFDLVTADGEPLTASGEENQDLFWALRGGGGNFGVVTSFKFRAHPVATVVGGLVVYPRAQASDVIRRYRDFLGSAPEDVTAYAALISTPEGEPATAVIACHCGDLAEGERALAPLRSLGTPLMDAVQPMPFPAMQRILDAAFPQGTYNYWKSTFIKELSEEAIDLIVDHGNRMRSGLSAVVIEFYGGASNRVGHADTAFAQRHAQYDIGFMAQWTDPAEAETHRDWARVMSDALRPHSSGGYLLNFLDDEKPDVVKAAFGANYGRLAALKAKYDPTNFFRLNQNIEPAAPA